MICENCYDYVPALSEVENPEDVFETCLCGTCFIRSMCRILGI